VASRLVVLMKKTPEDTDPGAAIPLGTLEEVLEILSHYNTAPDDPEDKSPQFLYGPGFTVQMPFTDGPITQLLVTMVEESTAWSVLARLCRQEHWKMVDPETGRTFG